MAGDAPELPSCSETFSSQRCPGQQQWLRSARVEVYNNLRLFYLRCWVCSWGMAGNPPSPRACCFAWLNENWRLKAEVGGIASVKESVYEDHLLGYNGYNCRTGTLRWGHGVSATLSIWHWQHFHGFQCHLLFYTKVW